MWQLHNKELSCIFFTKYYKDDKIKEIGIGASCNKHGRFEKLIQISC
jgi:hypothetical protein